LTFIIAIKSKNGIVFASDMQITDGNDLKYEAHKIFRVNDSGLAGFAGDVWFGKRILALLKNDFKKEFDEGFNQFSAERLARVIAAKIKDEKELRKNLGRQNSFSGVDMIITTINRYGEPGLLTMDSDCTPDLEYDSGFTCIGNAYNAIHPFLRSALEKVELDKMPIQDMKIIACRAVMEASKWVNGVGEGLDIWTLSKENGAVNLEKKELDLIRDRVEEWRAFEKKAFELIRHENGKNELLRKEPDLRKNRSK
jgi:20S proteasome alpha/beta subunit